MFLFCYLFLVVDDQYLIDILTSEYQSVEFWRRRQKIRSDPYDRREETNVINELFNAYNMEAILLLVHTGIGIQDNEWRSTHCHGFGFFNMAEDCLDVYVQLNYLISSGDIYLPHRWNNRWQLCVPSDCHCDCRRVLRKHLTGIQGGFTDYCGVTELLQYCFRFCYQYKMIRDDIRGMTALDSEPFDMSVQTYWDPLGFSWDVCYNPFGFSSVPQISLCTCCKPRCWNNQAYG